MKMFFCKETMNRAFVRVADKVLASSDFDYDDKISIIAGAKMMMEEIIRARKEEDAQYDTTTNKNMEEMGEADGKSS